MRQASITLTVLAASLVLAAPALGEPSAIASKEAEVQHVLAQVQQLDASLERAIEAYNAATEKLRGIRADLEVNTRRLEVARANLQRSRRILAARVVTLYQQGSTGDSTLSILLGATGLEDFLARADAVDRVAAQDIRVQRQVLTFRQEVQTRQRRLQHARAAQQQIVAQQETHRRSIEQQLSERRQLVSSIRSEIQRMKEAEARRQAELARQARERAAAAAAAARQAAVSSAAAAVAPTAPSPAPTPTPSASEPAPAVAPPASHGGVVAIAMRYLGTPYKWAGASPSTGFDCSGFVMYVYAQVGVSLPHSTYSMYAMGTPVARSQLQPGDLVFFDGLGHMGIYVGGGNFIHSPHTGDVVKISSMTGWYASTYVGARRV